MYIMDEKVNVELDAEEKELLKSGLQYIKAIQRVGTIAKWIIITIVGITIGFSSLVDSIKNIITKLWQ